MKNRILANLARSADFSSGEFSDAGSPVYDEPVDDYYQHDVAIGSNWSSTCPSTGTEYASGDSDDSQLVETYVEPTTTPQETSAAVDDEQIEVDDRVDRPQVPIGSPLTLTLELPQVAGVILLKAGPLVIRLAPETWSTESTSMTLPDFELMRSVDAEIYLLDQEGQLISSYSMTLVPSEG